MTNTCNTCNTCRFWQPDFTHREAFNGECHIRAPWVTFDPDIKAPVTAYPRTVHIDWCGEYQPKDIDNPTD